MFLTRQPRGKSFVARLCNARALAYLALLGWSIIVLQLLWGLVRLRRQTGAQTGFGCQICALDTENQHEPVNFESPNIGSLTGPRSIPLQVGAKGCVQFFCLCTRSFLPRIKFPVLFCLSVFLSSLVAIPVGKRSKENVDKLIKAFGLEKFTFMLFHYDTTDWSDMPWYNQVIAIRYGALSSESAVL